MRNSQHFAYYQVRALPNRHPRSSNEHCRSPGEKMWGWYKLKNIILWILEVLYNKCWKNPHRDWNLNPVGLPCQPYSRMGKGEQHNDPKYVCHQKYYELAPRVADLILLENVPEYNVEEVVRRELGNTWKCVSAVVDPRLFGFGTSRARVYGLAWKKGCFIEDPGFPLLRTLEALKARPMMMAKNFFWQKNCPPSKLSDSAAFWLQKVWLVEKDCYIEQIAWIPWSTWPTYQWLWDAEAQNLQDYENKSDDWQVADLMQLVRTGRGRTNPVDGTLMTLTTNSGCLWSKAMGVGNTVQF